MPVDFVNATAGIGVASDTLAITPGAGANYVVGFGYLISGTTAFTATFAGDAMSLLLSRIDEPDGLFNRATRLFGRVGNYTGASRNQVTSEALFGRAAATFSGVDQTTPTITTQVGRTSGAQSSVSVTIVGVNNPTGSRIVWACAIQSSVASDLTVNIGTIHAQPTDFGDRQFAVGSVAGSGGSQTITVTRPSGTSDMVILAAVLREASGGGPTATPALGRWRTTRP